MQESRDMRAGRTPSAWLGWVVFAGTMAIIALDVLVIYALIVHGRDMADR